MSASSTPGTGPGTSPGTARLPETDDLDAAEFALGALEAGAFEAARARRDRDPAFAAAVARWGTRFAALGPDALPTATPAATPATTPAARSPVEPAPPPWSRIAAALPPERPRDGAAGATRAIVPARPDAASGLLERHLRRWRGAALALTALAAALLLALGLTAGLAPLARRGPPAGGAPALVAVLTGQDRAQSVAVSVDPASGRARVVPAALAGALGPPSAPRAAELWLVPADGRARSLGVVDAGMASTREVAPALRSLLAEGATLAISVEPPGGSPSGQATGPVILAGRLVPN